MTSSITNDDDDSHYYTYDPFEGIDLDTIPELTAIASQFERQSGIKLPSALHQDQAAQDEPEEITPSTEYPEDEYNAEFFAQLESMESSLLVRSDQQAMPPTSAADGGSDKRLRRDHQDHSGTPSSTAVAVQASPSGPVTGSNPDDVRSKPPETPEVASPIAESSSRKRTRSLAVESSNDSVHISSSQDPRIQKKLRKLMDGFEDEMTCPICCDIFACAYLLNPCGHSYCGECGLSWITKNADHPVCAVCRARVAKRNAMVPNIALDNTVQKHVDALGENRVADWHEGGDKWLEWNHRKEQWKIDGVARMAEAKKKRKKKG